MLQAISLRSQARHALLLCCALLGGCGELCVNGICATASTRPGVPLLYADAGVRVERPSTGELPYKPGMALETGDIVQTATGYALIDFDDDNVVALQQNTRIQLGSIKLLLGEVFARIGKIIQRGGGQVATDELSASVTGTEYSVRRAPSHGSTEPSSTSVIVRKGKVLCEDRANRRWPAVELAENRAFRVDGRQMPQPPEFVDAQAATRWADEVIKRLLVKRPVSVRPRIEVPVYIGPGPEPRREEPPRHDPGYPSGKGPG